MKSHTLALWVILSCQLMVVIDGTIINVALPDLQRGLHFSTTSLSWVVNAYTLSFGGLLLLGARAGDMLGRRRMFLIGLGVFTVASVLGGFSVSRPMILCARAAQGVGGAIAAPSALALLTDLFPEGRPRTRALSMFAAVSLGGSALGQVLGGTLTQFASWRSVLFINVPVGVAAIILGRRVLRETPRQRGRLDLRGAFTSTLGMGLVAYGFVCAPTQGWFGARTVGAFVAGVVSLVAFVVIERHAASPIVPLRLFAERTRTGANVGRGLLLAGVAGTFFFLTQYLQDVLGYSPVAAGASFLPLLATQFAVSQTSSRFIVHRVSAKAQMLVGLSISAVGVFLMSGLSLHSGYPRVLVGLLLIGVGNGTVVVPITSAALAGVASNEAGAASGVVNAMQQVGGLLGVAVLVSVFGANARTIAHEAFVHDVDRAFRVGAFFVVGAVVLVAIVVRDVAKGVKA